jgi:hypothetical protein
MTTFPQEKANLLVKKAFFAQDNREDSKFSVIPEPEYSGHGVYYYPGELEALGVVADHEVGLGKPPLFFSSRKRISLFFRNLKNRISKSGPAHLLSSIRGRIVLWRSRSRLMRRRLPRANKIFDAHRYNPHTYSSGITYYHNPPNNKNPRQ